jgi:Transposase DDE domain
MINSTLWLKGFPRNLFGKPSSQTLLEGPAPLPEAPQGVFALISRLLPAGLFPLAPGQRTRELTPHVTALTWIAQALDGVSCRQALGKLADASKDQQAPGDSAYIAARDRLILDQLHGGQQHLDRQLTEAARPEDLYRGHRVLAADATGFSMPDTASNAAVYAYPGSQKEGCGFPVGQLLGLFDLFTAHIVTYLATSWQCHEAPLMMRLLSFLRRGDILVADTAYSSYALIARLLGQGSHAVMPLHQSRRLKPGRHRLTKPVQMPRNHWTKEQWDSLPEDLEIRVIADTWERPGFRPQTRHLVTTLLDSQTYPDGELTALYARRWDVELGFRNLKETMGLGILRTKTADRIAKEIAVNVLAYNVLRHLMWEGARCRHLAPRSLSFADVLGVLQTSGHRLKRKTNGGGLIGYEELLRKVPAQKLPKRRNPYRWEPRVVKRRPKKRALMTKPRAAYKTAA